ncbi:MAG TPA: hypothetical protein VK152_00270 [Paludibacter sp.]|nr:hypothetical protein [Paludibacter sp.]
MRKIERMKVPVRVSPIIREFLIDTTGTDTIIPKQKDLIWTIIKQHLETAPDDYRDPIDLDNYIYIELLDCSAHPVFSLQRNDMLYVKTLFRWHLSQKGQNKINSILRANFKNAMHSFIMGAISCNPSLKQKEAMEEFCTTYNLSIQKLTPDMIKKSWDRSEHKKKIYDKHAHIQAIFF